MPIDLKTAATTATNTVNNTLNGSGLVNGLQQGAKELAGQASNLANAVAGQVKNAAEIINIALNPEQLIAKAKSLVSIPGTPPFANALHNFASYNYIFTLSVLSSKDLNFPDDSYRKGKLGPIILQSGSGNPQDRVSTIFRSAANPQGKFDYFMDDVRISGIIGLDKATGNTNASAISFSVFEPYSMGLFFQSLQIAALEAGYSNYLDCPVLLRIEFKGHVDALKQNLQIPGTTRYIPIKIREIGMTVTGAGCKYQCEAYPYNEKAHSTVYSEVKNDITISGSSVQEMLQTGKKGLQKVINDRYLESVKRKEVAVPDQVVILFPTDIKTSDASDAVSDSSQTDGATVNPNAKPDANQNVLKRLGVVRGEDGFNLVQSDNLNPIGSASMGFNAYRKGDAPFAKDNEAYDPKTGIYKRGNVNVKRTEADAKFAQNTDIPNVINQIILASDYGRQALDPDNVVDGFINWWRIDTQVYVLDSEDNIEKTGRNPNLVVYRVIPYKVHHSRFMAANQPAANVEPMKKTAIKEYNYLYTGQNLDILDFAIEFKTGFYQAVLSDSGRNNQSVQTQAESGGAVAGEQPQTSQQSQQNSIKIDPETNTPYDSSAVGKGSEKIQLGTVPTSTLPVATATNSGGKGGVRDSAASMAARQFYDAVMNGVDMIQVNLKILGDPFYLGDSGMGNYSAQATNFKGLNSDGAINYQDGEVYINLKFKNPIDINQSTGRYDFPSGKEVPQFSGLFRVLQVESTFVKGQFTQQLSLIRMPGQDIKDDGTAGKTAVAEIVNNFNPNKILDAFSNL